MRFFVLSSVLLVAFGCGHATRVRPTPRGAYEVEAAVGGPLVAVGPVIPAPMSTVGVRYGAFSRGDVAVHMHLTSALFGVTGGDLDTTWRVLDQQGGVPHVGVNARLYAFNKDGELRNYLELTPSVSWVLGDRYMSYLSGTGFVQFAGGPVLFSAAVGERIEFGRFSLQGELRWYQPDYATRFVVTDWQSIAGRGGVGVIVSASYVFGGGRR